MARNNENRRFTPRERREMLAAERKKNPAKKAFIVLLIILALIVAALVAVNVVYKKQMTGLFYDNTTLNGYEVSKKGADDVLEMLVAPYRELSLEIREKEEPELSLAYGEFGYTVDEAKLKSDIETLMDRQNGIVPFCLFSGSAYGVRIPFALDEKAFAEAITQDKFSTPRVETKDAQMVRVDDGYAIEPETYGNTFSDEEFAAIVKDAVDKTLSANDLQPHVTVDVPERLYTVPTITSGDTEMNRIMNIYNKYVNAKITHVFGEEKVTIDWETIKDWIVMEDTGSIDDEKAYNYALKLAEEYDTMYYDRSFTAHDGRTIYLPSNDYGYMIDVDAEYDQIIADINANMAVEREPVYAERGFSRNGRDDLNGNYVEVDLSAQHLWLYRNGEVVIDSDIVSGLPKQERETTQGAFPIPYKESPAQLKGQGGGPGQSWDVTVQYWMPFFDGQGLHDASWRSAFGGSIYLSDGSHGCVNLPTYVAETIFNNIDVNFPVLLYK